MLDCQHTNNAMGIGGQREGAEASVEKQYAHTNVIDTLDIALFLLSQQLSITDPVTTEHSCHFGGRKFCADMK